MSILKIYKGIQKKFEKNVFLPLWIYIIGKTRMCHCFEDISFYQFYYSCFISEKIAFEGYIFSCVFYGTITTTRLLAQSYESEFEYYSRVHRLFLIFFFLSKPNNSTILYIYIYYCKRAKIYYNVLIVFL